MVEQLWEFPVCKEVETRTKNHLFIVPVLSDRFTILESLWRESVGKAAIRARSWLAGYRVGSDKKYSLHFGLAATQSKVLNRRELYVLDISKTCHDILEHIPGYVSKEGVKRPLRFSLYLSSQLMYGSVRVLQKQWEYLFADVSALMRKFHPEVSSEIDLILLKHEPVNIPSCVPNSKEYDPFFGMSKESTVDVEAYLEQWDRTYLSHLLSPSVQAELASPTTSVADPREIQIRDVHFMPLEQMVPGEQDLPDMDLDNLILLNESADGTHSTHELLSPQWSRILAPTDITQTQEGQYIHPPLEETPAIKTKDEMPRTPQKPRRKRQHANEDDRRPKHRVIDTGEGVVGVTETQTGVISLPAEDVAFGAVHPHRHDWLQQQPLIELSPVTATSSRRRKSHRLITDNAIQVSRDEIKNNMLTSKTTCQPMVLPRAHQVNWWREPGLQSLKSSAVVNLWRRNCVFGLRVYDTESESSTSTESIISPHLPVVRGVTSKSAATETPTPKIPAEQSLPLSVERRRDVSATSVSLVDQSLSSVEQSSQELPAGVSGLEGLSRSELEYTGDLGLLPAWPEEQDHMMSPIPQPPEQAPPISEGDYLREAQIQEEEETPETPRSQVLKLVTRSIRTAEDWTTFRTICPPSSCDRLQAARLFMGFCCQVALEKLCVRQDKPYADIFIWLPAGKPE